MVIDEKFDGVRAHPPRFLYAPARQDTTLPGRRVTGIAGGLNRYDQPDTTRQRAGSDALRRADFRIKQYRTRGRRERDNHFLLERNHFVIRHRIRRIRPERLAEIIAMVKRQDRKRAARCRTLLQTTEF